MRWFKKLFLPLGWAVAAACGSSEAPTKQMADSEAAVRAATELGAKATPEAALHLQMAKDRMQKAQALTQKGENESAKRLLEEAKADAELAVVLTREQQAETEARTARQKLQSAPRPQSANEATQTSTIAR